MDRYTDLVISKIPELGFTNLLYHIYSIAGLSAYIDISKFTTNCNGYVVKRFDHSPSAGKVTCIPLSALLKLSRDGYIPHYKHQTPTTVEGETSEEAAERAEIELKTNLLNALTKTYTKMDDILKLPSEVPLEYFFKPRLREKVSHAIDFSQMDLKVDDLARSGVATGVNPKIVSLVIQPDRGAWMSNYSIQNLVKPFSYKTEIDYLGQFNFNFLNSVGIYEKSNRFMNNMVYYILRDKIKVSKQRYVMFGFCYLSHWKTLIYDRKQKILAFYDSGGNNPEEFYHYPNFYFYSFAEGFNVNDKNTSTLDNSNCDVDVLMRFFSDEFGVKRACINREVNQLFDSECGMFSCLFMTLCTIFPPEDFKSLRRIYTFFRFLADKKMTLLKSILFDVEEPTIEVRKAVSDGLKEYVKMEKWTRKSANIISERINKRINNFLDDSPNQQ